MFPLLTDQYVACLPFIKHTKFLRKQREHKNMQKHIEVQVLGFICTATICLSGVGIINIGSVS